MLTVKAENRATIVDICNHWWINEGYKNGCLEEAEYLASLAPVRFDLLLSLNKQLGPKEPKEDPETEGEERDGKETPSVDIEEMPADTPIPDGVEECDISVSEEPDDSPRRRRKKEKRKMEASAEGQVPKKYEKNEEASQPPPPSYERAPEPMEEEQVYERPRTRGEERRKEDGRTPRVRRKHKSNEEVLEGGEAKVASDVQRKPPHKPKSPRPHHHHDQNGEVKKEKHRKEKKTQENGCQPFERPVPCASPRPMRTPPPPDWNEDTEPSPPALEDGLPPPLPEKKKKSPAHQPEPSADPEPSIVDPLPQPNLTQPHHEAMVAKQTDPLEDSTVQQTPAAPAPVQVAPPPQISEAEKLKLEEEAKIQTLQRLVEAVQNGFSSVQSMVQSLPGASPQPAPPPTFPTNSKYVAPVCDLPTKDNSSVIAPAETFNNLNGERGQNETTANAQNQAQSIEDSQVSVPAESASGKPSWPAEPEKRSEASSAGSVEEAGSSPDVHPAQQSQDQNPPASAQHSNEWRPTQPPAVQTPTSPPVAAPVQSTTHTEQPISSPKQNVPPPLVKPFPSQPTNSRPAEFPPKGIASPEPTSTKPPWVKDPKPLSPEDTQASLSSSPLQKEAPSLSITSIKSPSSPKQKDAPPLSPKHKEAPSINNLPKLKINETVPTEQEVPESPNQPPLVVPFPGKTGPTQLVKQDSPKSLINNIPKPFKSETEKPAEEVESNIQLTEAPSLTSPPTATSAPSTVPPPVSAPTPVTTPVSAPSTPAPAQAPLLSPQVKVKTPGLARSSPRPAQPIQYVMPNGTPRKSPNPNQMKQVESSPPPNRHATPKFPTASRKNSTDSVGSAISLSSDGDHRSTPTSPMIIPKPNGPNINMAQLSPSNSGSNIGPQDKSRDSKVNKAAQYWNNYIGEVKSKSRPPANPKLMEKPKKITSAGIGENALKDMQKAFESGKPITDGDKFTLLRRNSKKISAVESCNPGLRVNDAKSHFEKKAAQLQPVETPRMTRRASGTLDKPKLSREEGGTKSLLEPSPANAQMSSKSPSPQDNIIVPSKSRSKSKSPASKTENIADPKKEAEVKAEPVVQRNTIVPISPPSIIEPEVVQKPHLELAVSKELPDLPKPPTSPKPKVRKEELKLKEDIAKREDKPKLQQITKLTGDQINMVAPLKISEKETGDQALVKSLKDEPEKPAELRKPNLKKNHTLSEEKIPEKDKENNEVTPTTPLVKPILRDKSKKIADDGKGKETFIECRNVTKDSDSNNGPPKLVIKTVKIKSPEPEKPQGDSPPEQRIELSDVRSSLKRVPIVAVARRKSFTENEEPLEFTKLPSERKVVRSEIVVPVNRGLETEMNPAAQPVESVQTPITVESSPVAPEVTIIAPEIAPKERIIPIQLVNENRQLGPKPFKLDTSSGQETHSVPENSSSPQLSKKQEHHIPIVVEGKGSISKSPDVEQEKLDNFNTSSISRQRWGSRKKRMSSAFSDSSMSDDEALNTPFGQNQGLQKYSSYGKHAPETAAASNYALKKTRPPFSVTRQESFSSGEDDGLDDDGLQQISAENLFSTLLSRVKSLTRRIHDEHDEHISWQSKQRHGPPKLNPGGTHARLERTAQRNSIKRDQPPLLPDATPSYSRQSSVYSSRTEEPYSNTSSLRSNYGNSSSYEPRKIFNRSNSSTSGPTDADSRYSTGSRYSTADRATKRYDDTGDSGSDFSNSVSVTSSQRLRPGYLPPPANTTHSTAYSANSTANPVDPESVAQTVISRAQEKSERSIPISIQHQNSGESGERSKPGTPLPNATPGVYNSHMKPFSPSSTEFSSVDNSRNHSRLESPEPLSEGTDRSRRTSRFLRPDFYDTPKEDSIYAKMRDLAEEDKKVPRYLRSSNITRLTKSGRSTPQDYNSEDRSKSDSVTPRQDNQDLGPEGQLPNKALTIIRRNSMKEPTSRLSLANNELRPSGLFTPEVSNHPAPTPVSATLPAENAQLYRRTIKPYLGAKSEGHLLNKHANVSLNIIAAAERKKRQPYVGTEGEADQDPAKVTSPSLLS